MGAYENKAGAILSWSLLGAVGCGATGALYGHLWAKREAWSPPTLTGQGFGATAAPGAVGGRWMLALRVAVP